MNDPWGTEEADKQRLWEYIAARDRDACTRCEVPELREAYALIRAIDDAFTPTRELGFFVPVYYQLLQYLAGWNREALANGGTLCGNVRGRPGEANHFLARAFNALVVTLAEGVRQNRLSRFDGKVMFGCFPLPDWFVEKYEAEVYRREEHTRRLRQTDPDLFKPYLACSRD